MYDNKTNTALINKIMTGEEFVHRNIVENMLDDVFSVDDNYKGFGLRIGNRP